MVRKVKGIKSGGKKRRNGNEIKGKEKVRKRAG